ncbi:MAG: hypothetical protein M0036_18825 [Desulfobacteraceae bacterium]|nr:hypothetical protein [Desulfobacteraceae bacterium]
MSGTHIFIIRALLGVVFGILLARFFYPQASLVFTIGLCVILVGLAYLAEFLRRRKPPADPPDHVN